MEVGNQLVSWVIAYFIWGYNPFTKYHGHPSMIRAYEPLVSINKAGYETLISEGGT